MILGLVGKNASGKGEVVRILRDGGFEVFSLSDELRVSLERQGLAPSRDALTTEGRRVRREHGPDALARWVVSRFTPGCNQAVDSIRNPEEVRFLRTRKDFFLVAVDAPVEVRFERARARARPGDPVDLGGFQAAEERELSSGDPAAQQMEATLALADFTVVNDGELGALNARVREVFREAAARTTRPDWDAYFLAIAGVAASRSSCVKRKVAAVVVRDRRIVATGYNGTPAGTRNCNEGGCPRCLSLAPSGADLHDCNCSHAEENAIAQAALHGVSLRGATLYSTFSPCRICTKMIINSGIAEVVFRDAYPLPVEAAGMLSEAGVRVRQVPAQSQE
jgi:dCMP deaminase